MHSAHVWKHYHLVGQNALGNDTKAAAAAQMLMGASQSEHVTLSLPFPN